MAYRVVRPAHLAPNERLPAVYLLPGGGPEGFRQWLKYSHVARLAERRLILVMPEAGYPFYTNSFSAAKDRYEDYIMADLFADVERRFPVVPRASSRAFVGVSLGGFGAIKLALAHPHLVVFAGALSAPVDDASRDHDPEEQLHGGVFGPWGSDRRRHNDPFFLAMRANVSDAPYIYLACGEKENNIRSNRQFDTLLTKRKLAHEFHAVPEGHDWIAWERQLPDVFRSLLQHIESKAEGALR